MRIQFVVVSLASKDPSQGRICQKITVFEDATQVCVSMKIPSAVKNDTRCAGFPRGKDTQRSLRTQSSPTQCLLRTNVVRGGTSTSSGTASVPLPMMFGASMPIPTSRESRCRCRPTSAMNTNFPHGRPPRGWIVPNAASRSSKGRDST